MSEAHAAGQPTGALVDTAPAERPAPVVLEGRLCRIEKLDAARHGDALWQAVRDDDRLWTYMGFGPFADRQGVRRMARRPGRVGGPLSSTS